MTFQQTLSCAPWPLARPRYLTPFEWAVAYEAMRSAINSARGGLSQASADAGAAQLVAAIRQAAPTSPGWGATSYGPAPCVPTYAYGCLASWWGALDVQSAQRALSDIAFAGLLTRPGPPWSPCPAAKGDLLYTATSRSEFSPQKAPFGTPAHTLCAQTRSRTSYLPLDGPQLARMVRELKMDPAIAALVQGAKPFLLGVQLKTVADMNSTPLPPNATTVDMARRMVEVVAIITSPGVGVDVTQMALSGQFDPAKLMVLLQRVMPNALGDLLNQLPGLLQTLPGLGTPGGLQIPGWSQFLDKVTESFQRGARDQLTRPGNDPRAGSALDEKSALGGPAPTFLLAALAGGALSVAMCAVLRDPRAR